MKTGDIGDIFTPLILIPIYWILFQLATAATPTSRETLLFAILSVFWVAGQGMHLSANSIGHLLKEMQGTDVHVLTNFYDEVLSHYLWHFGLVGLSAVLIYRQWQDPIVAEHSGWSLAIVAGCIHGLSYFIIITEAATAPLGVPFAALVRIFILVWGRKRPRQRPLPMFLFVAYLVATLLFATWAIRWGGLPEFSDVRIID